MIFAGDRIQNLHLNAPPRSHSKSLLRSYCAWSAPVSRTTRHRPCEGSFRSSAVRLSDDNQ
eukprot:5446861-Heterocapsa_arctica.AAC.1